MEANELKMKVSNTFQTICNRSVEMSLLVFPLYSLNVTFQLSSQCLYSTGFNGLTSIEKDKGLKIFPK